MLVGGTNKRHVVKYSYDVMAKDDALAVRTPWTSGFVVAVAMDLPSCDVMCNLLAQALSVPPVPGKPFRWSKRKGLLDVENNGYT